MKKMNNKGFSLVELIVVVLIMAIIAVALAPQVMKWVENSRKATDVQNYGHVAEALEISYAKEVVFKAGGCLITCSSGEWDPTPTASKTGKGAEEEAKPEEGGKEGGKFAAEEEVIASMQTTLGKDWAGKTGSMRMRSKKYSDSVNPWVGMDEHGILQRDPEVTEDIES